MERALTLADGTRFTFEAEVILRSEGLLLAEGVWLPLVDSQSLGPHLPDLHYRGTRFEMIHPERPDAYWVGYLHIPSRLGGRATPRIGRGAEDAIAGVPPSVKITRRGDVIEVRVPARQGSSPLSSLAATVDALAHLGE